LTNNKFLTLLKVFL